MSTLRRRILRAFGRAQRPIAWTLLVLSLIAAISLLVNIWRVPDKPGTLLTVLVLVWQGWEAVAEVENELDSEASAES